MQHNPPHQQFAQRIAIDDRERNPRIKSTLERIDNVEVTVKRLSLGDYQVDDTLLVERKTLADFARSVRDCRLFTQVGRLTRQRTMRACLILEGTFDRYQQLAIPKPAFQGAQITVTLVFGLPVLRSATPDETADLILMVGNLFSHLPLGSVAYRLSLMSTHFAALAAAIVAMIVGELGYGSHQEAPRAVAPAGAYIQCCLPVRRRSRAVARPAPGCSNGVRPSRSLRPGERSGATFSAGGR